MALGPVDADGDLGAGGAQLLEEAAVGADPQVVLCDLHLEQGSLGWAGLGREDPPQQGPPARPARLAQALTAQR